MKGGHGIEMAVTMDNLRGGTRARYKEIPCSKYALEIKLVFGCFYVSDIANTKNSNLKRVH